MPNFLDDFRADLEKPKFTILIILTSILVFVGINLEPGELNWDTLERWGAPSSYDLYKGQYWGLITSNFLHTAIWHIAFNLFWIWNFGRFIELKENSKKYLFLVFSSAAVSSFCQLGFSDSTGIGLSGIGYAFFGYILIKGFQIEAYRIILDRRTIQLFLGWLIVCVILTQFQILKIGNAAHIGGLLWGMSLAYLSRFSLSLRILATTFLFVFFATSFIWNPYSTTYLDYQARIKYDHKQFAAAILVCREILNRDPDNEAAINLRDQAHLMELKKRAYQLHVDGDFWEARKTYEQILAIAPDDQWAKDNLAILPEEVYY